MTRLGNLLHFGQLFKACGNNYFGQISHIFRQLGIFHVSSEIIFGQLIKTFDDFLLVTLELSNRISPIYTLSKCPMKVVLLKKSS